MQQHCPAATLVLLADLTYNLHLGCWYTLAIPTVVLLIATTFLPLHILLALCHLLDLFLNLLILILVAAAWQFIIEVH